MHTRDLQSVKSLVTNQQGKQDRSPSDAARDVWTDTTEEERSEEA